MAYYRKQLLPAMHKDADTFLPQYPDYELYKTRLQTFKKYWPKNLPIDSETMAMQGLFYTGRSDYAICYGGFRNIDRSDDLTKIHAIMYGGCQFLYKLYSIEFVNNLIDTPPTWLHLYKSFAPCAEDFFMETFSHKNSEIERLQQIIKNLNRLHRVALFDATTRANENIKQLLLQNREFQAKIDELCLLTECSICLSNRKDCVLFCGHAYCLFCIPLVSSCPICRLTFDYARRLFL